MIAGYRNALWVSHSSMGDYLACPRAYYLHNIWRDPRNNHKISLISPPLALGQAVHTVIDTLSTLSVEERLKRSLPHDFELSWVTVAGEKGGFTNFEEEGIYKARGQAMIQRIIDHPGPVGIKAIKLKESLPSMVLSEEDNIILCGKIDWLSYDEKQDAIRIIDFKTGKHDEDSTSLQLPIYYMLAKACQKRPVVGVQYWYLERDDAPVDMPIPNEEAGHARILEIAKSMALARKLERFLCKYKEGCSACRPLEAIVAGKGKYVGESEYHQDMYILPSPHTKETIPNRSRRVDDLPF